MSLRTKFAAVLLFVLILPIVTTAALEINRSTTVMVDDLHDSANLLVAQTFEQIRAISASANGDAVAALRGSQVFQAFIESSQAFAKGVVYLRIEKLDGTVILGPPTESYGEPQDPSFDGLQRAVAGWWPPSRIHVLWAARTYEMSRFVDVNDKPFAIIAVGISTSLIAPEVHHSLANIAAAATTAIVLSLLGAAFLGGLVLRPLATITSGIEQIAVGHDDVQIAVAGSDELSILAGKFNQLSGRIRSNHAKREAEREQFLNVFHSLTDSVLLLDSGGRILFANTEAEGQLGLPAGGLAVGKLSAHLLGKDNPLIRVIDNVYTVGAGVYDVPLELSGGRHFLVSISFLGHGPASLGVLVLLRDLEPVRELENVVDHSDRLIQFGEVVSNVARQIRHPLNAIHSQLALLSEGAEKGEPIDARLDAVRQEIERLDKTVEALNPFVRPHGHELAGGSSE